MGIIPSYFVNNKQVNEYLEINQNPVQYFGLKNFANNCYCNSVLQALYHFHPFRLQCMLYKDSPQDCLLKQLGQLFWEMKPDNSQRGPIDPRNFIECLQAENPMYRGAEHHDAHEFFIFLVNQIIEDLHHLSNKINKSSKIKQNSSYSLKNFQNEKQEKKKYKNKKELNENTWLHSILQGNLVYETKCLCCNNISFNKEHFFDLSVDILEGSSLNGCIRKVSDIELLNGTEKYYCLNCAYYHEAIRFMKIIDLPQLLAIHLKRFRFVETDIGGAYIKLPYRVLLPMEIRVKCMNSKDPFPLYELLAVVVHIGMSMSSGHYISCIKSDIGWLLYDDQTVEVMTDEKLQSFFGGLGGICGVKSGYLLFYQLVTNNN